MCLKALLLISFVNVVLGRDFTLGLFRREDILVTQDIIFKERNPFRETTLKYGKTFACLVTYFRIADRLGFGDFPKVRVIRGGLQKKYIVVKLWTYNQPIAVTIQVGCQAPPITTTGKPKDKEKAEDSEGSDGEAKSDAENEEEAEDDSTKLDEEKSGEGEEEKKSGDEGDKSKEEEAKPENDEIDDKATTEAEDDEGEGEANENESLRRKNLIIV